MGKQRQPNKEETKKIIRLCSEGNNSLEISKLLKRAHRTIKNFLSTSEAIRAKPKRTKPKAMSSRDMRKLKNALRKMPHSTSRAIFWVSWSIECAQIDQEWLLKGDRRSQKNVKHSNSDSKTQGNSGLTVQKIRQKNLLKLYGPTSAELHLTGLLAGQEGGSCQAKNHNIGFDGSRGGGEESCFGLQSSIMN